MSDLNPIEYTLEPVGERCILIRVGTLINDAVVTQVHAITAQIAAAALPGVEEVVPAFTTVAVQYRPEYFGFTKGLPSAQLITLLRGLLNETITADMTMTSRQIEIPACYEGEFGPDLEEVARFFGAVHRGSGGTTQCL